MTDEATARRRHCEYIALRLGHVRDHDVGQPSTLLAMDIELEDIRAAWLHAVQLRDGEAVQAMAPPLARYFASGAARSRIALLEQAAAWPIARRRRRGGSTGAGQPLSPQRRSDRAEAAVRTAIRLHRAFRRGGATQPSLYLLGAILYTRGVRRSEALLSTRCAWRSRLRQPAPPRPSMGWRLRACSGDYARA
jgi:hypothetical protein